MSDGDAGRASRMPIRAILAATDALAGERVVVGGWVRAGRVQCGGTMAFLAVNYGSCHASLQLVVEAARVTYPPLARLAATGASVLIFGMLRVSPGKSKERVELGVEAVIDAGEVDGNDKRRSRCAVKPCRGRRW